MLGFIPIDVIALIALGNEQAFFFESLFYTILSVYSVDVQRWSIL